MKKHLLLALTAAAFSCNTTTAQEQATLSAQVYGYQQEMVYFDCLQSPLIAAEFHTNPGEEHLYSFECEGLMCLTINGRTTVMLLPGDSLHVDMNYEGKNAKVDYSGTERAVHNNRLLKSIDNLKRSMRYRSDLLGCVVLDIKPKARIEDARTLMEKATALIEKSQASEEAKNYARAIIDYDVYMSFIEYPVMYESTRGLSLAEQEIGDYWSIADGYTPRSDTAALRCPEYASLLMRYCFYLNEKAAKAKGEQYAMPTKMEDMYRELVACYEGDLRDYVLYTLLRNFIMNGKEIERADALYKDYIEKYNTSTFHKGILEMLLQ